MMHVIGQAAQGIDAGLTRLDGAARAAAGAGARTELSSTIVETTRARHEVAVNVAVLRVADDTIGSLIDILA